MEKKLKLSKKNKMIAGVCGGIAEFFKVDATIVRILWIILMLFSAFLPMLILYLIFWAVMPLDIEDDIQDE